MMKHVIQSVTALPCTHSAVILSYEDLLLVMQVKDAADLKHGCEEQTCS